MSQLALSNALVSVEWLQEHLSNPQLVVLDASWFMLGSERSPQEEYRSARIPTALFFDFDGEIKDKHSALPHMLPTADDFAESVSQLGISNEHTLVVYDSVGVFSSPRVWWMFKAMGHRNIAVLDGGLPAWKAAGYALESGDLRSLPETTRAMPRYVAQFQDEWVIDGDSLKDILDDESVSVLDARPSDRFYGRVPEPRKGIRSGHMPGAKNLPFAQLVKDGKMVDAEKLAMRFGAVSDRDDTLIMSCGSGITACILALGASLVGYEHFRVYDGSWTEWGGCKHYPVTLD